MSEKPTEDLSFGKEAWVYCDQHLRPHVTGWCTVSNRHKTPLKATTRDAAYEECVHLGFKIFEWNSTARPVSEADR